MNPGESNSGFANTATVQQLQNRLNEERTVQAIDRLLDRIDTLEKAVEHLSGMMQQGPGMLAMTVDVLDEEYRKAGANGVDIENRLSAALQLAEKLTAPAMVKKLDNLFSFVDQVPGLVAMTTDIVDEGYQKANALGISIEDRLSTALKLGEKLTAPAMTEKIDSLMQVSEQAPGLMAMMVDVFDEEMKNLKARNIDVEELKEVAQKAAAAVSDAKEMPKAKVGGIFSMIKTMRDPDRQKAIGFIMNVAKSFGQKL